MAKKEVCPPDEIADPPGTAVLPIDIHTTSYEALSVIKFSSYNQKWLWLAFFCIICSLGANVTGSYMVTGGACIGSYSWVGNLSRDSFKIGILWISTLLFKSFP